MNEIEIAAGAVIAAQYAVHEAYKRNQVEQEFSTPGSRHMTCANANSPILREAMGACELAARNLMDALARQNRMCMDTETQPKEDQ